MPQANRFFRLPVDVQREIDSRLTRNGFSHYDQLADELRQRGYRISRSALHRHGQELERAMKTSPDARALILEAPELGPRA